MDFKIELEKRVTFANSVIERFLPEAENFPGELVNAMRYSVLSGGKRIRTILLKEAYELYGGNGCEVEPFMAAIEMIHSSSLVHDDLPAIDNDLYRRGVKTTHACYGEALGVLTGDALLNYAYELILDGIAQSGDKQAGVRAGKILAERSGYLGLLGGQSVDVENEKKKMKIEEIGLLNFIYSRKTSAIIEASLMAGGALAGAPDPDLDVLCGIGSKLGLAFQIRDDILDVTGTAEELGKPVFSDEKNEKATYVTMLGTEEAEKRVAALTGEAVALIDKLPGDTAFLKELFLFLAERRK